MSFQMQFAQGRTAAPLTSEETATQHWVPMANAYANQVCVEVGLEKGEVEGSLYVSMDSYGWLPVPGSTFKLSGTGKFALPCPPLPGYAFMRAAVKGKGLCSVDYRYLLRGTQA